MAVNTTLPPHLFAAMHEHCRHGNAMISQSFTSAPDQDVMTTAGEGLGRSQQEEDTDFGAVMYITAVLVFYSLGIVVMIVKYLKTERKEMEEEVHLENFFKGIPSKRSEHEREAVNRVAIRAFHTLTSRSVPAPSYQSGTRDRVTDQFFGMKGDTTDRSDSDGDGSDKADVSPNLLFRERSKYLPRVSLMFRDNRPPHQRRRLTDRSQSVRSTREGSPAEGVFSDKWSPAAPLPEHGPGSEDLECSNVLADSAAVKAGVSPPSLQRCLPTVHPSSLQHSPTTSYYDQDSCRVITEDRFRPRNPPSHNSLRKLRNGDVPRSSVVSFSDGIQPGRRPRSENGPTKGSLPKGGSVLKSASPNRDLASKDATPKRDVPNRDTTSIGDSEQNKNTTAEGGTIVNSLAHASTGTVSGFTLKGVDRCTPTVAVSTCSPRKQDSPCNLTVEVSRAGATATATAHNTSGEGGVPVTLRLLVSDV